MYRMNKNRNNFPNKRNYRTFKNTKDIVGVTVYDWSDEITLQKRWYDNVKVDIFSSEYVKFLREEAYN